MPLARRIIPVILYRGQQTIKGRGFDSWRSIGQVRMSVRVYQARDVDELVVLNISGEPPDVRLVRDLASECYCPVTWGGGVRSLDHFASLIANGADKVAINTAAVETPDLIARAAEKFGRQAVVVSIDVKAGQVAIRSGCALTGLNPVDFAQRVEKQGAGEILLNSVERDGTLSGYDLDLIGALSQAVSIPVVACGGAGEYRHFKEALDVGAHAVAAGAMFSFTDATPAGAAEYLAACGIPVRRKIAA